MRTVRNTKKGGAKTKNGPKIDDSKVDLKVDDAKVDLKVDDARVDLKLDVKGNTKVDTKNDTKAAAKRARKARKAAKRAERRQLANPLGLSRDEICAEFAVSITSLIEAILSSSVIIPTYATFFPLPPLNHPAILSLPPDHRVDQQIQYYENVKYHTSIADAYKAWFLKKLPSKSTPLPICVDFLAEKCTNKQCHLQHQNHHRAKFQSVMVSLLELETVRRSTKILFSIIETDQISQFSGHFTKYSILSNKPPSPFTVPFTNYAKKQYQDLKIPQNSPLGTTTKSATIETDDDDDEEEDDDDDDDDEETDDDQKVVNGQAESKNDVQICLEEDITPAPSKYQSKEQHPAQVRIERRKAGLKRESKRERRQAKEEKKAQQAEANAKQQQANLPVPLQVQNTVQPQPTTIQSSTSPINASTTSSPITPKIGPFSQPIRFRPKATEFVDWLSNSTLPQFTSIQLPPPDYPQHLPKPNQNNSKLISKWLTGLVEIRATHVEQLIKLLIDAKNNNEPVCKGFLIGRCINTDEFQCCYNHDLDCYDAFSQFTTSHMKYQLHLNAFHIICRINQSSQQIRTQYQQDLQKYSSLINVPIVFGCPPNTVQYKSSLERFQCTGELVNYFENLQDYSEYYTAALTEEMNADRYDTEKEIIGIDILWQQASYASGDPKIIATVEFNSEQRGKLNLGLRQIVAFLHPDVPITIPSKEVESNAATFASNQNIDSLIVGFVKSMSYKDDSIEFILNGASVPKFAPLIQSLPREGWTIAVVFDDIGYKQQLDILQNISFNEKLVALFLGKQVQNNVIVNNNDVNSNTQLTTTTTTTTTPIPIQDWRSNSTLFPAEFLPQQITNAPSLRQLNDSQRHAIELALTNPVLSVQGPPGTGKSTTLSNLVYHLIKARQLQQHGTLKQFYNEQIVATENIQFDGFLTMMKNRADLDVKTTKGTRTKGKNKVVDDNMNDSSNPGTTVKIKPPQKLHPVLVAAPSNIAVDHLAELLMRIPDIDVLRISSKRHRSTKFANSDGDHVENAALHRRVEAWLNENPDSDLSTLHEKFFGHLSLDERVTLSAKLDDIMNTNLPQHLRNVKDGSNQSEMAIFLGELDRQGVRTRKLGQNKKKPSQDEKQQNEHDFQLWKKLFYELQHTIISNADVVCTTFALCTNRELFPSTLKFEHVILDEVSQGSEISLLLPLSHFPQHLVLFGDQQQLGPVVKQRGIYRDILLRSMFGRLVETKSCQTTMLSTQYRMHPSIALFSSNQFYDGKVKSGVTAEQRSKFREIFPWPQPEPICFISTNGLSKEQFEGFSSYNLIEIDIIVQLLIRFIQQGVDLTDIGLVLPYSAQCRYLRKALYNEENGFVQVVYNQYFQIQQSKSNYNQQQFGILSKNGKYKHKRIINRYEFDQPALQDAINLIEETLQIDTVDAFQGREKPLMIFNSVRTANGGRGGSFMTDNRLNVAITRAQYGFIVVGDVNFFDDGNNGTLTQFRKFYQLNQRLILPPQHKQLFTDFDQLVRDQIIKKKQLMYEQRQKRIQEAEAKKQKLIENRPIILSSNAAPFFPTLPPPE